MAWLNLNASLLRVSHIYKLVRFVYHTFHQIQILAFVGLTLVAQFLNGRLGTVISHDHFLFLTNGHAYFGNVSSTQNNLWHSKARPLLVCVNVF